MIFPDRLIAPAVLLLLEACLQAQQKIEANLTMIDCYISPFCLWCFECFAKLSR
jgi:hypothetical protein